MAAPAGGWIVAPTAGEAAGLLLDRGCGDPPGHRCDDALPAGCRQGQAGELPGPDAPPRTLLGPGLPCGAGGQRSEGLGPEAQAPVTGRASHMLCVELRARCSFNCVI